jgi:hypothetical protein
MHAVSAGKHTVDVESFTQGLLASSDLSHADAGGFFSSILTSLSGGLEALYMFPRLTPLMQCRPSGLPPA